MRTTRNRYLGPTPAVLLVAGLLLAGCSDSDPADNADEETSPSVTGPTTSATTTAPVLAPTSVETACPGVLTDVAELASFLHKIGGKHFNGPTDSRADELEATFAARESVEEPLATELTTLSTELGDLSDALSANRNAQISLSPIIDAAKAVAETCGPYGDSDGDSVRDGIDAYPNNHLASERQTIAVTCDVKGGSMRFIIDRVVPAWDKVWRRTLPLKKGFGGPGVFCESYGPKLTPVSEAEQKLWDAEKRPDRYTLRIPYEQCVEHGTPWTVNQWPVSAQQVSEAQAALSLCPDHPDGDTIRARIEAQVGLQQDHEEGRAFYDGNHRVGKKIEPGTYFTGRVENCYWERLDSAGNIIDNNFLSSALRVEVYISPSDFSFHSDGCGEWRQVP